MLAAAAFAAAPKPADFFDGQTVFAGGEEPVLTDIVALSSALLRGGAEPGAEIALLALRRFLAESAPLPGARSPLDRLGRATGPARFIRVDRTQATLQSALRDAGAARVSPQSDDDALIDDYFAAEDAARAARRSI